MKFQGREISLVERRQFSFSKTVSHFGLFLHMSLFTSFRKSLAIIFFVSVSLILFLDVVFKNASEIFSGGALLSDFIVRLGYSLIAATLFYFIAVHMKEYNSRKNVILVISSNIEQLIQLKDILLSELYFIAVTRNNGEVNWPENKIGTIKSYYPIQAEVQLLLKNVPLRKTHHPLDNWISRFDFFAKKSSLTVKQYYCFLLI